MSVAILEGFLTECLNMGISCKSPIVPRFSAYVTRIKQNALHTHYGPGTELDHADTKIKKNGLTSYESQAHKKSFVYPKSLFITS